jgi:hypothetical protein
METLSLKKIINVQKLKHLIHKGPPQIAICWSYYKKCYLLVSFGKFATWAPNPLQVGVSKWEGTGPESALGARAQSQHL